MNAPDNKTPHSASEYDQKVRQTIPFYEAIHQEILSLVMAVKPDVTRWLDTGCGTGYLVELALPLFPDTQFLLADPSEAMLAQARERLTGETRIRLLQPVGSEGVAAQVEASGCQVVTAVQCHHYLRPPEREQAVRACFDALEDGGLFVTTENITFSTGAAAQIGMERWRHWQEDAGRPPAAVADHLKRFGTEYFPITADKHLGLLKKIGFKVAEIFWLSQMQAGFYAIK
jgi:tRNA (cmo5U34)-methyltransferase